MRTPLIAGNWKMQGTQESVTVLLQQLKQKWSGSPAVEMIVLPPFVFLPQTAAMLADSSIRWGAQNLSKEKNGAYTGEISASMLLDFKCEYVLVGHSERRTLYGETNQVVAEKFIAAERAGLRPILCMGETLSEREQGKTLTVVEQQLAAVLALVDNLAALPAAVIAYEPVWAIGTGRNATPEQAQEVHQAIRQQLMNFNAEVAQSMRLLYGGSVKASNAAELFAMADIDGALVGGASLEADQFIKIGQQCSSY